MLILTEWAAWQAGLEFDMEHIDGVNVTEHRMKQMGRKMAK